MVNGVGKKNARERMVAKDWNGLIVSKRRGIEKANQEECFKWQKFKKEIGGNKKNGLKPD